MGKKEQVYTHGLFISGFHGNTQRKIGHIAPLQNKLNINLLSLFDQEQIRGGF